MINFSMDLSDLNRTKAEVLKLQADAVRVTANFVAEECVELLRNSPQYSGNFTANIGITIGDNPGGEGTLYFPPHPEASEVVSRGSLPAIDRAKRESSGFVDMATLHFESGGVIEKFTIFNNLRYAEYTEGRDHLRPSNSGGEHSFNKAENALKSRAMQSIVHGSTEYNRLAGEGIL